MLTKYESVFILDIRKVEDEGEAFSGELGKLIEEWGGKMEESASMGRKQFAREIGKRKAGIYWNYVFELDSGKVNDIREKFRLDDRVVRMLIINYDRPEVVLENNAETE
jgi:small subunit ribosomal protein S6